MKTSKRVLSVLLVVLMLLTSAPLGGVTDWFSNRASAATNANAKAVVDNICGTVGYRPGVDNYNDCYAYVSAFCKKMYGSAPGGVSGYTLTRPGSFYLVGQAAGTGVTAASLSSVLSQAMPGDVVQMYWDYGTGHGQHTAIVYSADSSAFTILQDGASFSTIKKSTYNYSSNYTRWRGSGYGISLYRHSNYNNLFGSNDKTVPTISNVKVTDVSTNGYTITCNVTDNVGIARVSFPTWTKKNDQDDIIWRDGTISGNTVTFRVNASEHNNELGWYATHIYAYDTSGNHSFVEQLVYLENTKPIISNIKITGRNNTGYTVTCNVSDNVGIARVAFPTWTLKNDQDDIVWKDGSVSSNTATFRVNISDHNNELGVYVTHIYAYDACGNYSASAITADMVINAASTTYKGNKYILFESNVSWNEAKRICESYGGHLVTITSAEENSVVKSLASKAKNNVWYGATDKETEGVWKWITGEAFTFSDWATGEPNNLDNQDYLQLLSKNQWDDVQECELTYQSFICEIEHTHTVIIESETSANCAKTGYTGDKVCDKCGVVIEKGTVIPATGTHSFGEWKQTKVATCTTKGEKIRTCSVCGKTETLSIDMLPHSYTSKVTKSPTCTATGVKTYTCSCGDSYTETIAKTAHSYTSKTTTSTYLKSGATCISPAVYYYKCASCSAKGTTTYTYGSALGHTGGTANCTDKAVCTRCQTSYGSVNASNHKSVVKDSAVAPTCITPGKTCGSHCSVCNKVIIDQNVIPANGHTESGWLINTDGTKHIECTVCHAVLRTETTEECDHSEKRSEYIVTPTCTQPGKLVYICDLCDEQLGEEDVEPLGHSYDIETVTKATLSKNGAVVQTCFDCDAKKTVRTIYYPKTFAVAAQVYTGKALKPSVIVKDSAGKTISSANYIVTYANNVAIGTATAKVTFRGNYSGTKTLIFAIVPAQVSKPKATQTTSTVTLSWSKVAGSNMRYYVFSYNPGTKKYTCLSYTTGTSYTVKKLSSGATYYYAVQAYNTTAKKWGKVSSVLTTATKPGTPTLKAVAGTRKATLSWNKQNGATGYLLYMATSKNGKYTKIATLKGNTKVSYTKTGLTKGRYYYFKVIAYKTVGSTNIYGAYSSVKYVKVK